MRLTLKISISIKNLIRIPAYNLSLVLLYLLNNITDFLFHIYLLNFALKPQLVANVPTPKKNNLTQKKQLSKN